MYTHSAQNHLGILLGVLTFDFESRHTSNLHVKCAFLIQGPLGCFMMRRYEDEGKRRCFTPTGSVGLADLDLALTLEGER